MRDAAGRIIGKERRPVLSPQTWDPDHVTDAVLDAAECLVSRAGLEALTIRAIARLTGFSTAEIYQMYGSTAGLLGHAWLRAAWRFTGLMAALIDEAHAVGTPLDEVLSAAETSLIYPTRYPRSAALLLLISREDLLGLAIPDAITDQLRKVDDQFAAAITRLSVGMWDRTDVHALDHLSVCVIDLPKRILTRGARYSNSILREYLCAAVRGVMQAGPPPLEPQFSGGISWSPLHRGDPVATPRWVDTG